MLLRSIWNGTLAFPYPVPFELLGDNAKGWLQTDYLSPRLRLSRGNKGTLFVLTPESEPDDPELEALLMEGTSMPVPRWMGQRRTAGRRYGAPATTVT